MIRGLRLTWLPLSLGLVLASCSSTIDRGRMHADLARVPLAAVTTAPEARPEVAVIPPAPAPEPELTLRVPFVLAIAPPLSHRRQEVVWEGRSETVNGSRSWSREERASIEAWAPELARLGLVSELVVLPVLSAELVGPASGPVESLRAAAARHHADAVLIVSEVEDSSNWLNAWSILDLTIVGAWFAPGHDIEVVSIFEGVVLDARTGYVCASAQGEGDARARRAWVYADDPEIALEARTEALAELGRSLMERARALAAKELDR